MKASRYSLERIGIGLLLCVALAMPLTSLVVLRGPDGEIPGDGFQVIPGLTLLRTSLSVMADYPITPERATSYQDVRTAPVSQRVGELPFSLNNASVAPKLIFAALFCAALALLDLLTVRRAVGALSLAGGIFAVLAVLHVTLMSSDLRTWTTTLINSGSFSAPDSPLLITRLLLVNSFQVSPGPGLYGMSACLVLVPLLSSTHSIPRAISVVRSAKRIEVSEPIRLHPVNPRYPEETVTSLNVSRTGVQVESTSSHYYAGMEVYLARKAASGEAAGAEEHGCVVRVEKSNTGKCRVAIRIIPAA
jgi:hypothetical protein